MIRTVLQWGNSPASSTLAEKVQRKRLRWSCHFIRLKRSRRVIHAVAATVWLAGTSPLQCLASFKLKHILHWRNNRKCCMCMHSIHTSLHSIVSCQDHACSGPQEHALCQVPSQMHHVARAVFIPPGRTSAKLTVSWVQWPRKTTRLSICQSAASQCGDHSNIGCVKRRQRNLVSEWLTYSCQRIYAHGIKPTTVTWAVAYIDMLADESPSWSSDAEPDCLDILSLRWIWLIWFHFITLTVSCVQWPRATSLLSNSQSAALRWPWEQKAGHEIWGCGRPRPACWWCPECREFVQNVRKGKKVYDGLIFWRIEDYNGTSCTAMIVLSLHPKRSIEREAMHLRRMSSACLPRFVHWLSPFTIYWRQAWVVFTRAIDHWTNKRMKILTRGPELCIQSTFSHSQCTGGTHQQYWCHPRRATCQGVMIWGEP